MRDFYHQMSDTMESADSFRLRKLKVVIVSRASCVAVCWSVREAAVAHHPGHAADLVPGLDTLRSLVPRLGLVTANSVQLSIREFVQRDIFTLSDWTSELHKQPQRHGHR